MQAQIQLTPTDEPSPIDRVTVFHDRDDTWFSVRFYGMSLIFATSEQFYAFRRMLAEVESYTHQDIKA